MKRQYLPLSAILLASCLAAGPATAAAQNSAAKTATLSIHAGQSGPQISRHIYGHFAEHLGRCIYGGLWVGRDSKIPNTGGVRDDIIEALKRIKIPNLRWPGGCFADQYHWRDGVGPASERPKRVNIHWGDVVEDNSFGTHEFLDFCERIGADPYVAANVGSGTPEEMMHWIEYMTFDGPSSLAGERRANGRADPWNVPFLGIGNENWGCGGRMTPEYYSDLYRRFSVYARDLGHNKLTRVAAGPGGTDLDWLEVLMQRVRGGIQGVSLHYYTLGGTWQKKLPAAGFGEEGWSLVLRDALKMEDLLTRAEAIMNQHDPDNRVGLFVDEWGTWYEAEPGTNSAFLYQRNTIRDAVVAGATLNTLNQHSGRVRMANIAQLVNVLQALILTQGERMVLTPTYHVFDMYQVHQDATAVPMELKTAEYQHGDVTIPALSASASRDDQGCLHLSLVNLDPVSAVKLSATIDGGKFAKLSGRILTASKIDAENSFDAPDTVKPDSFGGAKLERAGFSAEIPPRSVIVLALEN